MFQRISFGIQFAIQIHFLHQIKYFEIFSNWKSRMNEILENSIIKKLKMMKMKKVVLFQIEFGGKFDKITSTLFRWRYTEKRKLRKF